ncbi:type I polyketide synthase [Alteromonas sp. a30]|uniref:type I polyketide synthase n=1 Tax=Alteromonas sp. a30 TaxID=2730917 RepID=UPI00227E8B83|nr:beta-ketoacyl synthase N-terminal-like domain-containing protein [Alteromonas sp. a30]MCY7297024.1 hypothetical protein [Alteromonas sp. a30]
MNTEQELQAISALLGETNTDEASTGAAVSENHNSQNDQQSIAIIGVAAQLPSCDSVQAFWQALANGDDLIREFPSDRFDWQSAANQYDPELLDEAPQWAGSIDKVFHFDADFFNVPAEAASLIDPRQRLLMQNVYHCIEDAGYAPSALKGSRTGVFIGAEDSEYQLSLQQAGIFNDFSGSSAMLANNIAYYFDFCGASQVVNTLCSSGAVALHHAISALRAGEMEQAIVAAANLLLRPEPFIGLTQMAQLSPSRTLHSFGEKADGFIRSEGVISLLLKPLAQAQKDKDAIYAVVKNSAVNFNGQGGMSMASPNVAAHVEVIKQCYQNADISLADLDYIEAQGMATTVSDIAEWSAFNKAIRQLGEAQNQPIAEGQVAISTLKPTLGHMHAASSLGAMLKVIASFKQQTLFGIAHFEHASDDLDTDQSPCRLLAANEAWQGKDNRPRLAAVHSYGIGGNNAHILLQEYTPSQASEGASSAGDVAANVAIKDTVTLPVSAKTDAQLTQVISQLSEALCQLSKTASEQASNTEASATLASIQRTLMQGRDSFSARAVLRVNVSEFAAHTGFSVAAIQVLRANDADSSAVDALPAPMQQWLAGKTPDWSDFANALTAPRCHLPVYPFAGEFFRIEAGRINEGRIEASAASATRAAKATGFSELLASSATTEQAAITYVTQFIQKAMHRNNNDLTPQTTFVDYGVDSLIMVRLGRAIEKEMQVKLTGRDFMQCPDIGALSRLVSSKMKVNQQAKSAASEADAKSIAALNKFKSGELSLDDLKKLVK